MTRSWLLAALLFVSGHALAGPDDFEIEDDEDDIELDGQPTPPAPERSTEDDDLTVEENAGELEEFVEPVGEPAQDLLGQDPNAQLQLGGDTEQIYRENNNRLSRMPPDEELLGWDQYLQQYPNSVFRPRIEARMEELEAKLYARRKAPTGEDGNVDAQNKQIDFAHAMQLEQLNPRTRLQAGFEWGLPNYMNLFADYEKALGQRFSVHGGIRRRYSGFSFEFGPRIALVKSPRTNTIVSVWPDIHFNLNPTFPAFHPSIGAGKRFGKLDAQAQASVDLEIRSELDGGGAKTTKLRSRYSGGVSLYYAATDTVGFFGETFLNFRPVEADGAYDGGTFSFHVVTFGMKFFPKSKTRSGRPFEINTGATVPVAQNYWQYHYGSIMGQFNYYMED